MRSLDSIIGETYKAVITAPSTGAPVIDFDGFEVIEDTLSDVEDFTDLDDPTYLPAPNMFDDVTIEDFLDDEPVQAAKDEAAPDLGASIEHTEFHPERESHLLPTGYREPKIAVNNWTRGAYAKAFTALDKPTPDVWFLGYLGDRGPAPAVAAKRGYFTGVGSQDLPPTPEGFEWSAKVKAWADGTLETLEILKDKDGKFAGVAEVKHQGAAEEWAIMPAHTLVDGVIVTRPQLRWKNERNVSTFNEKTMSIEYADKKFDWPYYGGDENERALRAVDMLHFESGKFGEPVFATEGSVKVDALVTTGLTGIFGLPGVTMGVLGKSNPFNESGAVRRPTLLPEIRDAFAPGELETRPVVLVPDSDHNITPEVMSAMVDLASAWIRAGAPEVRVLDVPEIIVDPVTGETLHLSDGERSGIGFDDLLAMRMSVAPRVAYVADLIEDSIPFEEYRERKYRYEDSDSGRGERLADVAARTMEHLYITEGENAEGKWFGHGTTHWHVDAGKKKILRKAKASSNLIYGKSKDDTLFKRKDARSAGRLSSAVDLAATDTRFAKFSTIWEPMAWATFAPVKNGLVDCKTGELLPHTPDALNLHHCPVNYNPDAFSQFWEDYKRKFFVSEVVNADGTIGYEYDPEKERLFMELASVGLIGLTLDKFLIMKGTGGVGMGTTIRALSQVFGTYAGTLKSKDLCDEANQFVASGIVNRRFVVSGEPNDGDKLDGATIKTIAQDGEDRDVEVKNKTASAVRNTSTIFIPTNHDLTLDASAEDNDALRRRAYIIKFTRKIPDAEKSTHAREMLATAAVQEAILADLVKHIRNVLANEGRIEHTTASEKAVQEWLAGKDKMSEFLDAIATEVKAGEPGYNDPDTSIRSLLLWNIYKQYCIDEEIPEDFRTKERNFKAKVTRHWGATGKNRAGQHSWRNRVLKSSTTMDDED